MTPPPSLTPLSLSGRPHQAVFCSPLLPDDPRLPVFSLDLSSGPPAHPPLRGPQAPTHTTPQLNSSASTPPLESRPRKWDHKHRLDQKPQEQGPRGLSPRICSPCTEPNMEGGCSCQHPPCSPLGPGPCANQTQGTRAGYGQGRPWEEGAGWGAAAGLTHETP